MRQSKHQSYLHGIYKSCEVSKGSKNSNKCLDKGQINWRVSKIRMQEPFSGLRNRPNNNNKLIQERRNAIQVKNHNKNNNKLCYMYVKKQTNIYMH